MVATTGSTLAPGTTSSFAGNGDDEIEGGAGSDLIDGGRGFDTAIYASSIADYTITGPSALVRQFLHGCATPMATRIP